MTKHFSLLLYNVSKSSTSAKTPLPSMLLCPPNNNSILFGNSTIYDQVKVLSNSASFNNVSITIQMIEQIRYSINKLESDNNIQQTSWCGGFYSDEFSIANKITLNGNTSYYSNIRKNITDITAQNFYEILNAIYNIYNKLSITGLISQYDKNLLYSKFGITGDVLEYIRFHINYLEGALT